MFIGGMLPFLIASITMTAVGDAAFEMIKEIRRQFREIPGLLEGTAEPDNAKCVDIATTAALKRMVAARRARRRSLPGGGRLRPRAEALGGMLGGALLGLRAAGLIHGQRRRRLGQREEVHREGQPRRQGLRLHKAAVVGDTVGDPFKDTSGPSMNILINVMAIVSLAARLRLRRGPPHAPRCARVLRPGVSLGGGSARGVARGER
jgi:K(+)-stimulated pyrophosphate-energized sodium pump